MGRRRFKPRYVEGVQEVTVPDFSNINASRDKRIAQNEEINAGIHNSLRVFDAVAPGLGSAMAESKTVTELGNERIRRSKRTARLREDAIRTAINDAQYQNAMNSLAPSDNSVQATAKHGMEVDGSKQVEAEKDELIFRKINGRYKLIADLNGGKTHLQGGEDVLVQHGDTIFPGNKRKDIIKLLDSNGYVSRESEPKFNTMRLSLPDDDGNEEKGLGVTSVEDYNERQKQLRKAERKDNFNQFVSDNAFEAGTSIGTTAPLLYNLFQGSKKEEKETRRFVNPRRIKFVDTSRVQKNQVDENTRLGFKNVTNLAGGSSPVALSNLRSVLNESNQAKQSIDADTTTRAQAVENANTQISNEANRINTNLAIDFDVKDAQNRAARRRFIGEATSQISGLSQRAQVNKQMRDRDAKMERMGRLRLLYAGNTADFEADFELQNRYLSGEDLTPEEMKRLIRFKGSAEALPSREAEQVNDVPMGSLPNAGQEGEYDNFRNYLGYKKGSRFIFNPHKRRFITNSGSDVTVN